VRYRRHIRNTGNFKSDCIQSTHGGLTARTGALDANFKILHTALLSRLAGSLGSNLRSKWRALARALETCATGGRPGQCIALTISNRDDRIVEGSMDVGDALGKFFLTFLRTRALALAIYKSLLRCLDRLDRTLASTCIGLGALTTDR
jgi:hypothetical protein